jgi:hypothetical protein
LLFYKLQIRSIAAGPGVAWNAETDSYGEIFKSNKNEKDEEVMDTLEVNMVLVPRADLTVEP